MKVVVTGGAGFIGSHVCDLLASRGDHVVVIDDLSTGFRSNLEGIDAELVEGSILDAPLLDRHITGAGAVVHLAARGSVPRSLDDPMATHVANATGTLEVLEAVRRAGGPHLVLASSSSVYGANPKLPRAEDDMPMPRSPYAASKLATEQYALAHAASYGLDVLAFRFFNVFGPRQTAGHAYAAVVPAFVDAAMARRPLPMHGDGLQTRDFTTVSTVAAVVADVVGRRVSHGGPVNLAFGSRVSLRDLVALLEKILGRSLAVEYGPPRAGDVRDTQADDTLLKELVPDIVPVSLEDGLRQTVDWFSTLSGS
jgi:UDP-glucose 4-epimerase